MSRWAEQYKNHPFQTAWSTLKTNLDSAKVDDETVLTSVQELARLKKVVSYIDEMLNSIDPELVPSSTWDNFNAQTTPCNQQIVNFNSNKNIGHIQNANNNADNLLTYIRPYMVIEGEAGKALLESVKEYSKAIEEYLSSFHNKAGSQLENIKNSKLESDSLQVKIQEIEERAVQLKAKLLGDESNEGGIESQIDNFVEEFESKLEDIKSLHDKALVGDAKNPSIKDDLESAKEAALADKEGIEEALDSVKDEVKALDVFHTKIFGKLDEDGKREGGLAEELNKRVAALGEFENKQVTKYNALNQQIEELLPGAASAGLASAYRDMKKSFDDPIKNATKVYYFSIGIMVVASFIFSIENIGGEHWISFVKFENWDSVLKGLVFRLPFYGAVIWLAFVASKRRSEYQRLQQEYAHKEALATSYESYKKQLADLDKDDKVMQKELITKAIDAIAYNASQTLDGKHGDNHPTLDLVGKVLDTVGEIKDAMKKKPA
ncbi:MAG: hypothetical protein A2Z94_00620 [Gallionellales bacterium GWA2_55_18]|nr:MAG: hypothetical protein A2Z94_00620 [Gallionellales bacterium GWA2_55_18]